MLVLYLRRGCPYCNMVLEELENSGKKYKIYWEGEDFSTEEFKKEYGENATFPRGYIIKNNKNRLLKDSRNIIYYLQK